MISSAVPRIVPLCISSLLLLSGCAIFDAESQRLRREQEARRAAAAEAHTAFRAQPKWKGKTYRDPDLMAAATPENTKILISLQDQRGLLLTNDMVAMDFPVATGKRSHPTPTGTFTIIEKKRTYSSNLYGKIYDAENNVVNSDANTRTDTVPEGGRFEGASMPYWMRLTNSGVGLHVGYVPGRPASHGCIRLPRSVAPEIFERVKIGTPVEIQDSIDPANLIPEKPSRSRRATA